MKKRKIEIGKVYSVKVGESVLPVRIDESLGHGHYEGMDMHSGKKVKVAIDAIRGDGCTAKQWHLQQKPQDQETPKAETKASTATTDKKKPVTVPKADKNKRPSGLDAAAKVLAEAGEPLNAAEMVKRMLAKGLWKTSGKTPTATIYAAIIREIAAKGKDARFRKTARGMFELAK
ncbi:MAG: winged helix-turn-helix domain-containing protein [Phycisphaerae bacterium]|jgi:hypothetical protein